MKVDEERATITYFRFAAGTGTSLGYHGRVTSVLHFRYFILDATLFRVRVLLFRTGYSVSVMTFFFKQKKKSTKIEIAVSTDRTMKQSNETKNRNVITNIDEIDEIVE